MTEIYINNQRADTDSELRIVLDKVVSEFRNPNKATGSYSYTVKLPLTETNRRLFAYESERHTLEKFRTAYPCYVEADGVELIYGTFAVRKFTRHTIEGNVFGQYMERIADLVPKDKKLTDIQSFAPLDFRGDATVWDYLDRDLDAGTSDVCFPFVVDSFARLKYLNGGTVDNVTYRLGYEDFGVSHFVGAVFRHVFGDLGYTLAGGVLDDDLFNRLVLLYSDSTGGERAYNYGTLNPLTAKTLYTRFNPPHIHEGEDYFLYSYTPEKDSLYATDQTGDLSFSLGRDGVYTCAYTSEYDIDIRVEADAYNSIGNGTLESKAFLLFRELENAQTTEGRDGVLPSTYDGVSFYTLRDAGVCHEETDTTASTSAGVHTLTASFSTKLVKGRQYAVQVVMAIKKTVKTDAVKLFVRAKKGSHFNITRCAGRTLLDPAKFLPDMTQIEFVQAVFKLFNLYYQIDNHQKTIHLYTRGEWFDLNKHNILDISKKVDLDNYEMVPIEQKEIDQMFYRWATDSSDYLLAKTDYMERVNGDVPENSPELPFAPLAFLRQEVHLTEGGYITATATELVPCAIPATDQVDLSLLDDFEAQSRHGYLPKLAVYHGAGVHPDQLLTTSHYSAYGYNKWCVSFDRSNFPFSVLEGGFQVSGDLVSRYKHLPKLSFFNLRSQPAYQITEVAATREFHVEPYEGETLYHGTDLRFVTAPEKLDELDAFSISSSGDKSTFNTIYRDDKLISRYANYFEGVVKIDPVLWNNLSGRNILRVDGELYLLESVTGYEVTGDFAKIKIYQLIAGK